MLRQKDLANTRKLMLTVCIILMTGNGAFAQSLTNTWGNNSNGQLGRPMPQSNFSPGTVSNLGAGSGTIAVVAGVAHSLALKSDGTVLAWGSNANGQLGDGTTVSKLAPVQVNSLGTGSGVVAIAAGANFSMALKSDGTVLAWGLNTNGQLGDGSTSQKILPGQVSGLGPGSGVVSIAAGLGSHSLALKSDGTVLSWGLNSRSQLGDGTNLQRLTPIQTSGIGPGSGVVAIVAGGTFSFALKMDGTVLAWGENTNGQLGDGTTALRSTPVQVSTFGVGSGVIAVAAGLTHTLALKSDGTIWSWGFNGSGQLGTGTFTQRTTPGQVSDSSGIGFLAGGFGIAAGSIYSLALRSDGSVLGWGDNASGNLGDGTVTLRVLPVQVNGLTAGSGVAKIAGSNSHSLALKTDGCVLAWGSNNVGQLGRGTFDGTPASIQNLVGIDAVAAGVGGTHSLAHKSDGTVLAWGFNIFGQVGDGTTTTRMAPVQVAGLGPSSGVVAIAAGASHSLALKANGAVVAWGSNTNGQLGDGTTTQRTTPVSVMNLGPGSGIIAIAAGNSFSLALAFDGTVWAWGLNTSNQLGDGTLVQRNTPIRIPNLGSGSGVIAIAAGSSHALAVKSDGTLWGWGLNTNGQLGDGTTFQRSAPVQVLDPSTVGFLTRVSGVAAGSFHSLAVLSDGAVLAWGLNTTGQVGDGTLNQRNIPVPVNTLGAGSGVLKLTGGASHSLALKSDGVVWVWGSNSNGQLGDGSLQNQSTPVPSIVGGASGIAAGSAHSLALSSPPAPADSTGPVITPTVAGTLGNNGWYRSDVTVTWSITDPESSISSSSGCSATTLNTDTAGTTLTCTAVNSAGLTGSGSVTIKIDKTEPFVSFTRTAANGNGWNNTAVSVHFTATDALSGIDGVSFIDRNITAEGKNQTAVATFTDLAGNSVTASVDRINIDMTAPMIQFGAPNPAANPAGWNKSDVQITFTTSDNLSGVVSTSVPSPLVLSAEGMSVKGSVVVTDAAGNTATAASPAVKIDKTNPVAWATASPLPSPNGWNNTDVTVTFTGSDSLSGISACSTAIQLTTNGTNQSASGSCTDVAGNVSQPATISGINIDKTAPTIWGMPAPDCMLWPANGELVKIASISVKDGYTSIAANALSVTVVANEPVDASDIVVSGGVVQVRATRLGNGNGRVYTVVARVSDVAGNTAQATGSCTVPHDMGRSPDK